MSLNILDLKNEADRLKKGKGGNQADFLDNFVKMPEGAGTVSVRLLGPAEPGKFDRNSSPFYQETRIHKINNKSLHCRKTYNKKTGKYEGDCPICQYYSSLWKKSEDVNITEKEKLDLQAKARLIKPVPRYYFNCIVRQEKQKDGGVLENVGPKILSIGETVYKKIITGIVGDEDLEEKGYGDVTHPTTGRDFKLIKTIKKSGDQDYPNYDSSKFLDVSPLGTPDQIKMWADTLHDLAAMRQLKSEEEMVIELKKHLGLIPNDPQSSGGFDLSELEQSPTTASVKVVEAKETKVSASTNEVDEAGIDEDFLKALQDLN